MLCWLVLTQPRAPMLSISHLISHTFLHQSRLLGLKRRNKVRFLLIPQQSFPSTGKGGSATEQTIAVLIRLLYLESVLRYYFLIVILFPFVECLCLMTPPDTLTTILALSRYLLLPDKGRNICLNGAPDRPLLTSLQ